MLLRSPSGSLEPFKRLQVTDGLLLTAERWRVEHEYHRRRQNVYYQSLHQPGIVWGLGVCLIPPPPEVAPEHRDRRWLQIQPGLAIDRDGNPIVVPQPLSFRIASDPPLTGTQTVYVVIRYVDPDRLQGLGDRDLVQETFRLNQTVTLPADLDIELCRIQLQPGELQLTPALDVLKPGVNNLDLRSRQPAQARSQITVQVAQLAAAPGNEQLASLLRSVTALYPAMQALPIMQTLLPTTLPARVSADAPPPVSPDALPDCDLLWLTQAQLLGCTPAEHTALQHFLATGAVVLVEVPAEVGSVADLSHVQQQLQDAIASLSADPATEPVRQELQAELAAITAQLTEQIQAIAAPMQALAQQFGIPPVPLDRSHPLRSQPFLFGQLPHVQGQPISLMNWGGLVLIIGALSTAWSLDESCSLSRGTIRTAQEFGINLLHFAWQRRQLTQLQQPI